MRIINGLLSLLLIVPLGAEGVAPDLARRSFRAARELARRDGGRLWGRSLEGPILVVDPATLAVAANVPDREGALARRAGLYQGVLAPGTPVANTEVEWGGRHWTEVLATSLAEQDPGRRDMLLMHESFHRIQKDLGLRRPESGCAHLETEAGRVWLRLEWRALGCALDQGGAARLKALRDALAFRAARFRQFPEGRRGEGALEINEGLAEYTGLRLALRGGAARRMALLGLAEREGQPHLVRAFPYASGPAYGLLLDALAPGWRRRAAKAEDLASLLPEAVRAALPGAPAEAAYGGDAIRAEEHALAAARAAREADLRRRFQAWAVLTLPGPFNISFNPNRQEEVEGLGTVHPGLKAKGDWGTLRADGDALLAKDWSALTLPAPAEPTARRLEGPGYTLDLAEGWEARPGARPGDWTLRRR